MKYLILTASLIISTFSCAMKQHEYQAMLNRFAGYSKGQPSITIDNKTPFSLSMEEIGDLEKDNISSTMPLRRNSQLTFSPYAYPFNLKKEYMHKGTSIKLIVNNPNALEKPSFNLFIGGISYIKFGDTVQINYDKEKGVDIVHNSINPTQLKVKRPTNKTLRVSKDNYNFTQDHNTPKRSSTFS